MTTETSIVDLETHFDKLRGLIMQMGYSPAQMKYVRDNLRDLTRMAKKVEDATKCQSH